MPFRGESELSARKLHAQLELPVSVPRVKQFLNESPMLKFLKRGHVAVLTERHKAARVKWCTERCRMSNKDWARTIFRAKRSSIWMEQMDSTAVGTIWGNINSFFRLDNSVVARSWFGVSLEALRQACWLLRGETKQQKVLKYTGKLSSAFFEDLGGYGLTTSNDDTSWTTPSYVF